MDKMQRQEIYQHGASGELLRTKCNVADANAVRLLRVLVLGRTSTANLCGLFRLAIGAVWTPGRDSGVGSTVRGIPSAPTIETGSSTKLATRAVSLFTASSQLQAATSPLVFPLSTRQWFRRARAGTSAHERLHARVRGHPSLSRVTRCMHAMPLVRATTQLISVHGGTAPQWAELQGQPTTAELGRQHAAPPLQWAELQSQPTTAELGRQHAAPPLQKVVNWQGAVAQEARPATLLTGGAAPAPGLAVAAVVAPLPRGWKEAKARDGRTYYFHTETKETTWTRPAAAPAASATADPPLPAGWKEAKAADGRIYYYLPGGKGTQWVRPTEPDAPAPLLSGDATPPATQHSLKRKAEAVTAAKAVKQAEEKASLERRARAGRLTQLEKQARKKDATEQKAARVETARLSWERHEKAEGEWKAEQEAARVEAARVSLERHEKAKSERKAGRRRRRRGRRLTSMLGPSAPRNLRRRRRHGGTTRSRPGLLLAMTASVSSAKRQPGRSSTKRTLRSCRSWRGPAGFRR